jgi:hypothetical protein
MVPYISSVEPDGVTITFWDENKRIGHKVFLTAQEFKDFKLDLETVELPKYGRAINLTPNPKVVPDKAIAVQSMKNMIEELQESILTMEEEESEEQGSRSFKTQEEITNNLNKVIKNYKAVTKEDIEKTKRGLETGIFED